MHSQGILSDASLDKVKKNEESMMKNEESMI